MISEAMEDYLKAIYTLGHEGPAGAVKTGALAAALGIAASSATGMCKKLAGLGLVEHQPRRGATLTRDGERIALRVLRRHRLLTCYLSAALGYGRDAAHDEAGRLAPAVSDALEPVMHLRCYPSGMRDGKEARWRPYAASRIRAT